jgi:hypothetical protein
MDLSRIALCVPGDINLLIDKELAGDSEQTLISLINGFSEMCQQKDAMNRSLEKKQYSEFYDGGVRVLVVKAPPITNDDNFEVWEDTSRVFDYPVVPLVKYTDYTLVDNGESGVIKRLNGAFTEGSHVIKIVYVGGLVLNTTTGIDVPADLRQAAAMQVAYWWKNRDQLGVQSLSMASGTVSFPSPSSWLDIVKKTVMNYRHFRSF